MIKRLKLSVDFNNANANLSSVIDRFGKEFIYMKYIKTLVSMLVCGAVMAVAISASAQTQGAATIVRLQGEARYSTGDNIWHPLEVGIVLRSGAIIQTAAGATVDIVLDDKKVTKDPLGAAGSGKSSDTAGASAPPVTKQNVVRMWGDTVLAIDKLLYSQTGADAVSETQLDLRAGKIFGTVKKLTAASKYEIKTPTGIAGIRGTSFGIGADGSVTVYDGSVTVSINGGAPITIPAGYTIKPGDTAPSEVVIPPGQTLESMKNAALGSGGTAVKVLTTETTETVKDTGTQVFVSPTKKTD